MEDDGRPAFGLTYIASSTCYLGTEILCFCPTCYKARVAGIKLEGDIEWKKTEDSE